MSQSTEGPTGQRPGTGPAAFARLLLVASLFLGCVSIAPSTAPETASPALPATSTTTTAPSASSATASPAPTTIRTPSPSPPAAGPTFDELNANSEIATFDDLETNSFDWVAHTLYFKGIVAWVVPTEPQGALMGIEVNRQHDTVYARYTGTDTFAEGGWVEFVGQYSGLFDYETESGDRITLPAFQSLGQQGIRLAAVASFEDDLSACTDRAHQLFAYHWAGSYDWFFNDTSTPAGLDHDEVLAVLERSIGNITEARNDCGLPDNVSATAQFMGTTDEKTGIIAPLECPAGDGVSIVGFGRLPPDILGLTCPIWHDDVVTEVDISLNNRMDWALSVDECFFQELLEATATHEFGHAFGLAHVNEGKHPDLTMSTISNGPCSADEISLGLGDILGLEQMY
ncbi:MAG TPA: hypothetical protein VM284_07320 [Candidatus Limnocylindria bacterium]|nr:hypothetical protein [Candidatus Limnocylindria bacterium]